MKLQKSSEAIIARALAGSIHTPGRLSHLPILPGRAAGEARNMIEPPGCYALAL